MAWRRAAAAVDEIAQVEGISRRWRSASTGTGLEQVNVPDLVTLLRIVLIPVLVGVFYLPD